MLGKGWDWEARQCGSGAEGQSKPMSPGKPSLSAEVGSASGETRRMSLVLASFPFLRVYGTTQS